VVPELLTLPTHMHTGMNQVMQFEKLTWWSLWLLSLCWLLEGSQKFPPTDH